MIIRRFEYSNTQITKMVFDNGFLWIAFSQDNNGICHLKKVDGNDLSVVYYDLELEVPEIVDLKVSGDFIYVLYNGEDNFLTKYSITNPLTFFTNFARETTDEVPIGLTILNNIIYLLLPGIGSGTNANILSYNSSGIFIETIDLMKSGSIVNNAISITNDGTDLWVVTNENPSNLIRVFNTGIWDFTITELS